MSEYFITNNIPFAIIGGVAVLFQGRFRTTEDIDVIILHDHMNTESFVNFCQKNSLSVEKYELEEGFKEKSHISIFDLPNGIRIDLDGGYTPWHRMIVKEADTFLYENIPIKVAKPEHLIINKLFKGSTLDLEDAFSVYFQNQERINDGLLEKLSSLKDVKDQFQEFLVKIAEFIKESD